MCKKEKRAYMTVEAALIVPMVVGGIIFILYLGFYLYNVCAVKQAAYIAALRGSQMKKASDDEVEMYVEQQLEQLLEKQLLTLNNWEKDINVSVWRVKVQITSDIKMPFSGLLSSITDIWKIEGKAEANRINPVEIIRGVRKTDGSQISE